MQGLAAGAEFGGAVVMSAEYAPAGRRGLYAALPAIGVSLGILLASAVFGVFDFLPRDAFVSWGWRVPFLFSIVIVALALIIRLRVAESPVFKEIAARGEISKAPIRDLFREARKPLLIAFAARIGENGAAYTFQTWILTYIVSLKLDRGIAITAVVLATTLSLFTIPLWGMLSDYFGRKAIYLVGTIGVGLFTFPCFGLIGTLSPPLIVVALCVMLAFFYQAMFATQGALLTDLFEPKFRFSGIALARETSAVVAGGFAPFIATALISRFKGAYWPVAIYVIVLCAISTIALFFYKETFRRQSARDKRQ
jgi:MHS family metabolite:H+ symporter-like MFS transporter